MMTNLFSMFDPSTKIIFKLSLNWMSIIILLLMIPNMYWLIPNSLNLMYLKLINLLYKEFKIIIKKNNNFNLTFISLFIMIMMNNFMGLFPYIFTSTSHLSINLMLALPLWLSMMLYGWINTTNNMFIHLVPQGTPIILIPFMVLIESISNIIRPITLTIRLTANMIAGHLLLTLLGNMGPNIITMLMPILLITQLILLILESAVAIIQSYVFSVLMTLYFSEI
uniref:ATP synthase subunit a n=1 Tax=Diptera sp. 66 LC-2017 TaxID=2030344 RepID=A0A343L9Z8_9DIPT|nr:ATP synthase F0 subunit 6 [Diptera sp. 66 LC-2017]